MFLAWSLEISKSPIEALYVGEDALPVWFVVVQHVLHLQQRVDTSKLFRQIKAQGEVIFPIFSLQTVPVKTIWVEDMDQGAEGQAIRPVAGEVGQGERIVS